MNNFHCKYGVRSIYLVLDTINDVVHPNGPNGKCPIGAEVRRRGIIERTRAAIDRARIANVPVGFVRVGFSFDYGMSAKLAYLLCRAQAWSFRAWHLGRGCASGSRTEAC
jgi:nicotinamidase-related amidase